MVKQASWHQHCWIIILQVTLNEECKYNILSFSTTILPNWKVLYLRILLILRTSNKQFSFFTKYSMFIKSLIFNIYIFTYPATRIENELSSIYSFIQPFIHPAIKPFSQPFILPFFLSINCIINLQWCNGQTKNKTKNGKKKDVQCKYKNKLYKLIENTKK